MAKATHFGRAHAFKILDEMGLSTDTIKRAARCVQDSMIESYATNTPMRAMLVMAGAEPDDPSSHFAPHLEVEVPEEVFDFFAPWWKQQKRAVEEAWQLARTKQARKEQCLYSARGGLDATRYAIETALQGIAAQYLDARGVPSGKTMLEEFPMNTLFRSHLGFTQPAWRRFAQDVRKAQDRHFSMDDLFDSPRKRALDKVTRQHTHRILRRVDAVHTEVTGLSSRLSGIDGKEPDEPNSAFVERADNVVVSDCGVSNVNVLQAPKRKRTSAWKHVKRDNTLAMIITPLPDFGTLDSAYALWDEYTKSRNGRTAFRDLERAHGSKWRACKHNKQKWNARKLCYDFIEKFPSASDGVIALQSLLETCTNSGNRRSKRPAWTALFAELRRQKASQNT